MSDLSGKWVVLAIEETLEDRVKMRGALFQTGDVGIVLAPAERIPNAWIVVMHGRPVLFFTDELKEYDNVICQSCKSRGLQGGCGESCGTRDCFCQHRARPVPAQPEPVTTAAPDEEG